MASHGRELAPGPGAEGLRALQTALGAIGVRGTAASLAALWGADAEAVCASLRARRADHGQLLPVLTEPYWSAVQRIGGAGPSSPVVARLTRALTGAEADPGAVRPALRMAAGVVVPDPVPLPAAVADDVVPELWRRSLRSAAQDYWDAVAGFYALLHPLVRDGAAREVDLLLRNRGRTIDAPTERLRALSDQVGQRAGVVPPDPAVLVGAAQPGPPGREGEPVSPPAAPTAAPAAAAGDQAPPAALRRAGLGMAALLTRGARVARAAARARGTRSIGGHGSE